ncbi:MAG TPA: hypothetical protein VKR58_02635 [Aquella sp.]|nr:hypothetical protein [Aquella sp.]
MSGKPERAIGQIWKLNNDSFIIVSKFYDKNGIQWRLKYHHDKSDNPDSGFIYDFNFQISNIKFVKEYELMPNPEIINENPKDLFINRIKLLP